MTKNRQIASVSKFEQVLRASAQMPGVRIDRDRFLRSELTPFCTNEQVVYAIATNASSFGNAINDTQSTS